jgi:hypothetical protein
MSEESEENIEFKPPVTLRSGQIQFVEACHPPLVAGEYRIGLSQLIKASEDAPVPWNSDPYATALRFTVDAPRFTLDPSAIHSVYPPVNESGRFDNALAHVVFTRRTLPWERTLDGEAPEFGRPFPPWLALILATEDELAIRDEAGEPTGALYEARSLPVADGDADSLLFPRPAGILAPDLSQGVPTSAWVRERALYEKASCLAIDLPTALFRAIAPRNRDLPYLAHVRQVDTGDKEVLGFNDRGWFSLVIGNRLPQADTAHRAFLVSLEGHKRRLDPEWQPGPGQRVRLAVLASWTFTCTGTNDFKARMDALNPAPSAGADRTRLCDSWLRLPHGRYDDDSASANDIVNGAYARGYTAFDHVMRHGERTVSWYRGPLVPLNYDRPAKVQEPVSCADELLRYDPHTGLFDATYAAAWQLGRLLALQNRSFALALARTRRALRARALDVLRSRELDARYALPPTPDVSLMEDRLMRTVSGGAGASLTDAVPE